MQTVIVDASEDSGRELATGLLRSGSLVAFPTDTVYGLAAYPWEEAAVERLYQVKQRPKELPIPLLLSDSAEVERVAMLPARCRALSERFWPGGLTLVLEKKASVSRSITDRPTVAVRVPNLPLARDIIRRVGGVLAVTSANISGAATPVTAREVEEQLGGRIALIVDGGSCPAGVPSTVLDCSVWPPVVLRSGVVGEHELQAVGLR